MVVTLAGQRLHLVLPPDLRAASQARCAISAWATANALAETDVDCLRLIVTELVTNAVVHAGTFLTLCVTLQDAVVWTSVRDHDVSADPCLGVSTEGESGRGLLLVDALAHAWGVAHDPDGKTIWAEVALAG